jgi:hypothetical protein
VSLRGGGLIAPALHDAPTLTVEELMAALKDLVSRARSGRLRSSEMSDSTITVTNLGDQGVEAVHGVIYPPQVALLGLGRVVDCLRAVDGLLGIRPVLTATLAADHRSATAIVAGSTSRPLTSSYRVRRSHDARRRPLGHHQPALAHRTRGGPFTGGSERQPAARGSVHPHLGEHPGVRLPTT